MQFTASAAALLAFASAVLAQTAGFDAITSPTKGQTVDAGSTLNIVWQPSAKYTGTVTLSLLGGTSPSTLVPVETIKSGISNSAGKYSWAVESTLGKDATYGIQITLDSDKSVFQYSFPFVIKAGAGGSGSSYSTSATGSTYSHSSTTLSSYKASTTYASNNLSTTATGAPTKVTLTTTAGNTGGSGATATQSAVTVPSSGAQTIAAGSLAMLGGIAMAAFAL